MLNLPYSPDTAEDLAQSFEWRSVWLVCRDICPLLLPSNHMSPLLRGYKPSPSSCIFHQLVACLRSLAANAADPAITLASFKVELFSIDVMVKSFLPACQTPNYGPRYLWGEYDYPPAIQASLHDSQKVSRKELCLMI